MLEKSDSEMVRAWLRDALVRASDRGIKDTDIAKHCGVSPQAVYAWKRTGRIKKSHLEKLSAFLGERHSFIESVAIESTNREWPFQKFSLSQFLKLPIADREKVETYALFIIREWEQARLPRGTGAAAA